MKIKFLIILTLLAYNVYPQSDNKRLSKKKDFYSWSEKGGNYENIFFSGKLTKGTKHKEVVIKKAEEIRSLEIESYSDSIFPNEIILKFKHLETLVINGKIGGLKIDTINIKRLSNVKDLVFLKVDFKIFPVDLYRIDSLKRLTIAFCKLEKISDSIKFFKNLNYLDLISNELNSIPETIKFLQNLKTLWLGNNNLTEIPAILIDCNNLERIGLNNPFNGTYSKNRELGNRRELKNLNQIDYVRDFDKLKTLLEKDSIKVIGISLKNLEQKDVLIEKLNNKLLLKKLYLGCYTLIKD